MYCGVFFFQAEDGIRDLVRSRGLGDVYKRQLFTLTIARLYFYSENSNYQYIEYHIKNNQIRYVNNRLTLML